MDSGAPLLPQEPLKTDELVTGCLRAARNLGHVSTYRWAKVEIEVVRRNIEELALRLSTTQRSLLATAVLYYLWNLVKTNKHHKHPKIISINDNGQLSIVGMTCFIWIKTWTEACFNLIRLNAVSWTTEITTDFNGMGKTTKISELNTRASNAANIPRDQTHDAEMDEEIKSLLTELSRHKLEQCFETLNKLTTRLSPIWLSTLAVVVLQFLFEAVKHSGPSEHVQKLLHTCLHWILPIDEDLAGVDALIEQISPESMITWNPPSPTSGFTFDQIWHGTHTFEEMENPWEMKIVLTENTVLCHSTTCGRLVQMLQDTASNVDGTGGTIKIKGRKSPVNYTGANLVWTAVQLTDPEKAAIPDSCAGKSELIASSKGYGSVCLQFPLGHALFAGDGDQRHAHILSTRKFGHEYSQAILVSRLEHLFIRRHEKGEGGDNTQRLHFEAMDTPMDSPLGYKWQLGFSQQCGNKSWTFPELVFHDDLDIPLHKLKVSFNSHKCGVPGKNCDDCGQSAAESRQKFDQQLRKVVLHEKYDVHEVSDELNLNILLKNSFT